MAVKYRLEVIRDRGVTFPHLLLQKRTFTSSWDRAHWVDSMIKETRVVDTARDVRDDEDELYVFVSY